MLTLMLFIGMLAIAATAVLPDLIFQIKRDREEEMVHRGVQYTRAVRRYYRKFGGYPTSLEQLSAANNIRFLRKRYKDPVTGQDFKLLHLSDVMMVFGTNGGIQGGKNLGIPVSALNNASATSSDSSSNTSGSGVTDSNSANANSASQNSPQSNSPFVTASGQPTDPQMGGGPIVGVASTSDKQSIRIYNKKDHYKDWLFAYDPTGDRGAPITGPWQPTLAVAGVPGQMGLPGQQGFPGQTGFAGQGGSPGMSPPTMQPMGGLSH